MKKTLIILILIVTGNTSFACRCWELTFEQEAEASTKIFHGRVISADHYTFDIEIIQLWKGDLQAKTFQLKQGKTSCEMRSFELDKEYIFYVRENSVINCSRTQEYHLTADAELLDFKFKNIGDKKLIESNSLTDKEIEILKPYLKSRGVDLDLVGDGQLLFAIQDDWVHKWAFISNLGALGFGLKLTKLDMEKNTGPMILWMGTKWDKSLKRLKKSIRAAHKPTT